MSIFITGLDLGQTQDFTAMVVLERSDHYQDATYQVRHLERFQLGTSYVEIVQKVTERFSNPPLTGSTLVVDQTGVGRAVVDLLRDNPNPPWYLRPITITGGHTVGEGDDRSKRVPKKDLVGCLQILLQAGRLKIARSLPEAAVLVKELENFRIKVSVTTNESFEAWRDGDHDDLVLGTALACWEGENGSVSWNWVPRTNQPGQRSEMSKMPGGVFLCDDPKFPRMNY
jgi:Terminase RNaseH-like domain